MSDIKPESQPQASDFAARHSASQDALRALGMQVESAPNWQEKYRALMLGGKALMPLPDQWQQDAARVRGCESAAWLYHHSLGADDNKRHYFIAASDARIVNGLIALLLGQLSGQTTEHICTFDIEAYFRSIGLEGQLSPSRTNGLYALAQAIKAFATQDPH
ncbi:SufE family protein [Shewanella sp. JM162201]|uniref:SufE family protein n=1 Tax=Shewanella jiangmenensis TaxID=2837387 RepID=A0ABS5V3G0_9GAMM|nr:SufE family protein [Shewanella jiangmenensis]MBT1443593.1 SufE family protein [Shewanella jiangmenensis]